MTRIWPRLIMCLLLGFGPMLSFSALAHDTPVALLTLTELRPGEYQLAWQQTTSQPGQAPELELPEHCVQTAQTVMCGAKGLVGRLAVSGLGRTTSAVVVRITSLETGDDIDASERQTYTLSAANPEVLLRGGRGMPLSQVAATYVPLGIEHILLGLDHLLFVAGLMWLVAGRWRLVKTITAFTLAHSITLICVTIGWIGVPESPVNALIALSIALLAVEIVHQWRGMPGATIKYPWLIAFGFGLLHGMGFANALASIGLPEQQVVSALLVFNIGVELGQLAFVVLVMVVHRCHGVLCLSVPRGLAQVSVYTMGTIACFWFISRLALMVAR